MIQITDIPFLATIVVVVAICGWRIIAIHRASRQQQRVGPMLVHSMKWFNQSKLYFK